MRAFQAGPLANSVAAEALTSILIPPLSIYWRLRGAIRFRVLFF